jgi:hypothetical protein
MATDRILIRASKIKQSGHLINHCLMGNVKTATAFTFTETTECKETAIIGLSILG